MTFAVVLLLPVSLLLAGCTLSPQADAPSPPRIGMANPASVYCQSKGGKSIPVVTAEGERADCQLPRGERLDEWTLFRQENPVKK